MNQEQHFIADELINTFISMPNRIFNCCYLKAVLRLDLCIEVPCRCLQQHIQFNSQRFLK